MRWIEAQTEDDRELARRAFSWITYAYRPLTLEELRHVLAIEPDMTDMDFNAIVDAEVLTSVCAGLIVLQVKEDYWQRVTYVRLVHYTAQEYFQRNRRSKFPDAQGSITIACLTCLSFYGFKRYQDIQEARDHLALVDYAGRHWGNHARGPAEETRKEIILEFLQDNSKVARASQLHGMDIFNDHGPLENLSGMHLSAIFGLVQIMKYQLENGIADSKDSRGRTPLSYAARNGDEALVTLSVAQDGVEVNSKDEMGRTPLSWAAAKGHDAVVRLLLGRDDVEVNSKDKTISTPLLWAAKNGHDAVAKLLLAQDKIEVNSKNKIGSTPLSLAAYNGHDAVVRLLLAQDDVEVNSKDETGRTPLSWAAICGVVKLLLARDDVVIDSKDAEGTTPLSWAVKNGHDAVVKLLLAQDGVEVNSKD